MGRMTMTTTDQLADTVAAMWAECWHCDLPLQLRDFYRVLDRVQIERTIVRHALATPDELAATPDDERTRLVTLTNERLTALIEA